MSKQNELAVDRESDALKKLQASAGIMDRSQVERLDWMYEQSAASVKKNEDELMNMPVAGSKDQDLEDVKKLGQETAGSLFLRSVTKTTEDMLRKLREDPLFQIRRQEQAARANMMANPLIMTRVKQKQDKEAKKIHKKAKKAAKKEKKALKKAAKKDKKQAKKAKDSSDSDSSSSDSAPPVAAMAAAVVSRSHAETRDAPPAASRRRDSDVQMRQQSRSPRRRSRSPKRREQPDLSALGPAGIVVDKRAEYAAQVAARRDAALASRGASRRLTEEEKQSRYEQMKVDAALHEQHKDKRIASAELREKQIEELESKMRANSDQTFFKDIRKQAYMGSEGTIADRLKNQRGRRGKNLNDPLERDG